MPDTPSALRGASSYVTGQDLPYRALMQAEAKASVAATNGNKYWFTGEGATEVTAIGTTQSAPIYGFAAADHAVTGGTTVMRLDAMQRNAGATTVTWTVGLYPVTNAASPTLGTVVTGSTAVFTTPSANAVHTANSGDFTIPSDGAYAIGYIVSGTTATIAHLSAVLLIRNV